MRLYLIKRKSDGLFYVNINGYYQANTGNRLEYWSNKGRFLRTPDGVAANLRKLCSEPYFNETPPKGVCAAVARDWSELAWRNFNETRLEIFEVVVMDVDVISMKSTPATEFIQVDAIKSAPLNRTERCNTTKEDTP